MPTLPLNHQSKHELPQSPSISRILILGAGKMGTFFSDLLSTRYETAIYDCNPDHLRFIFQTQRFKTYEEIETFHPHLVINAVSLQHTLSVFKEVLPYLPPDCILSDIASVKTDLKDYYLHCGRRFVSTHPMFGPTFANLGVLQNENAIIIKEGDAEGKDFFHQLYHRLGLHISIYTFEEHDETVAYSLSIPFVSTFVFAAVMKHQDAPGTTFKRHMKIAEGVLGEDDCLLREILFNPKTPGQVKNILEELKTLLSIIDNKDEAAFKDYLTKIRQHIL